MVVLFSYSLAAKAETSQEIQVRVNQSFLECEKGFEDSGRGADYYSTQCKDESTSLWDEALNRIYAKLMSKLGHVCANKLKKAQRAWISSKDADADAYAAIGNERPGKSEFLAEFKLELLKERYLYLERLLEEINNRDKNDIQIEGCFR